MRNDGRTNEEIREIRIVPDYIQRVPGSVLIEMGHTRVVCTATCDKKVPYFMKDTGKGWINAEYSMLPGSTGNTRLNRERYKSNSRHIEIQRFIGRALRNTFRLKELEDKTITIDTDVLQADGSTRCAALNGAMIALVKSLKYLVFENQMKDLPELEMIAAVSIGIKGDHVLVDLNYEEDKNAEADINVISSEKGNIIEIQGSAEEKPIPQKLFQHAIELGIQKNLEIINIIKNHI